MWRRLLHIDKLLLNILQSPSRATLSVSVSSYAVPFCRASWTRHRRLFYTWPLKRTGLSGSIHQCVTSCTQTQLRTRRDPKLFPSPAPKSCRGGLQDRPASVQQRPHNRWQLTGGQLLKMRQTGGSSLHPTFLQLSKGNQSQSAVILIQDECSNHLRAFIDAEVLTEAASGLNMCFHFPGLEQVLLPSQGHHNGGMSDLKLLPSFDGLFLVWVHMESLHCYEAFGG